MASKELVELLRHYDELEGYYCSMDAYEEVAANQVVSWAWLARKWQWHRQERERIEALMIDVLPSFLQRITSCYELLTMWLTTSPGSTAQRMIEDRIAQEVIATTTNWFDLEALLAWVGQSSSPFVEQVKAQMRVLLFEITSEECPVWFSFLLCNIPRACIVLDALNSKVQELKAELRLG